MLQSEVAARRCQLGILSDETGGGESGLKTIRALYLAKERMSQTHRQGLQRKLGQMRAPGGYFGT